MARARSHEETRAYMRRLCEIIAADRPAPQVLTPEEETRRAIRAALASVQHGAPYGYMSGARLEDYRRIERIGRDLEDAWRLGVPGIDARTAAAVAEAGAIAGPWRGRWE